MRPKQELKINTTPVQRIHRFNMENKRKFEPEDRIEKNYKHRKINGHINKVNTSTSASSEEPAFGSTKDETLNKSIKKSRKACQIKILIRDLEEVLDEESRDSITGLLSEEALSHCLALQACLRASANTTYAEVSNDSSVSSNISHELSSLPKIVSPLILSPWKSSSIPTEYPSLPNILDPTLKAATFIHCSVNAGHKGALNYEQLELIGDAYMELIATLLISQTFPYLSPGKQSQIREMLVKNITLANYSLHYKFDRLLKIDWALLNSTSLTKVKVLGDVFEAYVAAVVLSDPIDGVGRVSQWLKDLWSMTIAEIIIREEKSELKNVSHLWHLRGNLSPEKVAEAFNNRPIQLNAKEQLQKLIGGKHAKLSYKEVSPPVKDPQTKLPVFSMGVFLDGWGEKNKQLGTGQANGKKEAGLKAAAAALENKILIKKYSEQKTALKELEVKNNEV
ncbi:Ribonuclease 3 [Golovinomyces cichoracearum]|uniref:Ribonuclease 3 n=1 Tax=Golovinomyces cichoracearum TaxID=62708 RepID=A0A420J425_9PEZI|nr:Ribonuclease 3 [Golovinomyces cichoracearum]